MRSKVLAPEKEQCASSVVNILRCRRLSASAEKHRLRISVMRLILTYLISRSSRLSNCRRAFGDMADVSGDLHALFFVFLPTWMYHGRLLCNGTFLCVDLRRKLWYYLSVSILTNCPSEHRRYVKVEVVVLGSPSQVVPMMSVDVKQHLKKTRPCHVTSQEPSQISSATVGGCTGTAISHQPCELSVHHFGGYIKKCAING